MQSCSALPGFSSSSLNFKSKSSLNPMMAFKGNSAVGRLSVQICIFSRLLTSMKFSVNKKKWLHIIEGSGSIAIQLHGLVV
jgi:hypothetical protein